MYNKESYIHDAARTKAMAVFFNQSPSSVNPAGARFLRALRYKLLMAESINDVESLFYEVVNKARHFPEIDQEDIDDAKRFMSKFIETVYDEMGLEKTG